MFKQFLKNWDDTFHEDLKGNQKRLSSCSSLITWDDYTLFEIKEDSRNQSYMEIQKCHEDNYNEADDSPLINANHN